MNASVSLNYLCLRMTGLRTGLGYAVVAVVQKIDRSFVISLGLCCPNQSHDMLSTDQSRSLCHLKDNVMFDLVPSGQTITESCVLQLWTWILHHPPASAKQQARSTTRPTGIDIFPRTSSRYIARPHAIASVPLEPATVAHSRSTSSSQHNNPLTRP